MIKVYLDNGYEAELAESWEEISQRLHEDDDEDEDDRDPEVMLKLSDGGYISVIKSKITAFGDIPPVR